MSAPARARAGSPACPLCGGTARHAFDATDLNRATDDKRFAYWRCEACATYFQPAPPTDLAPYYPHAYYELPSAAELDDLAQSQAPVARELLERAGGAGRLIEIGPGEGVFARAARNAGFDVTAIEMDARACEHLREAAGVQAINSSEPERVLATLPPSRVVVMWHVIEHLRRPWEVIERAAANLQDGGVLALATPNPASLQFKLLRRRWAHVDAPRHLYLLDSATLERRCSEVGLRLASTTTTDAAGLHWNRFGWQYALKRAPRSRAPSRAQTALSGAIATALAPLERRGANGCAYTSTFVKRAAS
ncbi:MAG: class I SAM-dependent methyltransferase [Solirubrobacteraceae bacterium]